MKKLLLITLSTLFFISCKNEDSSDLENDIIGSWKFSHATPKEVITIDDFITQSIENTIKNYKEGISWKFDKNGKVFGYYQNNKVEYSYTIESNKILIFDSKYTPNSVIYRYEFICINNTLTLVMDETKKFKQEYSSLENFYNPEIIKIDISKVITSFNYTKE